jgi:hypothetical protein
MRWMASQMRALLLVAGLGLVVLLVARLGPGTIARQITSVGPGIAWLLVAYAAGTAVAGVPWYLLLPRASRPRLRDAVASRFAAAGANAVLPLFGVGGEPARLLWLPPRERARGVAAIIVDRLLFVMASGLFLCAGVLALLETHSMPDRYVALAAVAAAALVLVAATGAWLASRSRLAERIHRIGRRLTGKDSLDQGDGLGADIDRAIAATLERPVPMLGGGVLIHLVGRVLLGAEIYIGFLLLGVPLTPAEGLVFASVPVLLSFVGSVVPSQLGLQEGTQALVAMALGISPAAAVTVVLLQRVRQLATVSAAWLLILLARQSAADSA